MKPGKVKMERHPTLVFLQVYHQKSYPNGDRWVQLLPHKVIQFEIYLIVNLLVVWIKREKTLEVELFHEMIKVTVGGLDQVLDLL